MLQALPGLSHPPEGSSALGAAGTSGGSSEQQIVDLTVMILEIFSNPNDPMVLLIPFFSCSSFPLHSKPCQHCSFSFCSPLKGVCSAFQSTSPSSLPSLFITTSIENIFLGRIFADLYPSFLAPEYTQLIKDSVVRSTA